MLSIKSALPAGMWKIKSSKKETNYNRTSFLEVKKESIDLKEMLTFAPDDVSQKRQVAHHRVSFKQFLAEQGEM